MKIAYILPSLENRGPIIFTQYLIDELKNNNIEIEVFYFNEAKTNSLNLNVKCRKISKFKKHDFTKFDIVHTTMALPDLYASFFINKNKWICSMHNELIKDVKMSHSKIKSFLIIKLWLSAIKKCKEIIVSSNQMKFYYEQLLKNKKINYSVIPYGICEKKYSEILPDDFNKIDYFKSHSYKIIGSVGLLIPRKGFSQLFSLLEKDEKLALVIIGDGFDRSNLEYEIKEKHLENRVFLPGFRNYSFNYYKYFDIYAHVSYSEGFGLAMLEAMSKKLPIICSNLAIYHDYFTDDDVSFFEPGNEKSLFLAYKKIINNFEKYKLSSYKLFSTMFNVKTMARNHIELYSDFIKSQNS